MKEQNQIVIYQSEDGTTQLQVNLQDDTIWLTQSQIVDIFNSSKANISEHIKHIFSSGELSELGTVRKFRTVQQEGNRSVTRNSTITKRYRRIITNYWKHSKDN